MGVTAYQLRTSFRRRARRYLAVTVLLGLAGGLGLFAFAGARRTQSSYSRFLRSVNASTMALDAGGLDADTRPVFQKIAHLPEVRQARSYGAFDAVPLKNGKPDFTQNFEALGSLDGRYFDQDRFAVLSGRRPDPRRVDEIAVNEEAAKRYHYHVGQHIDLATFDDGELNAATPAHLPKPKFVDHVTVVAIGAFPEEVVQDESDRSALILMTPAYSSRSLRYVTYSWQGLVLRHGDAEIEAVKKAFLELVPKAFPQFFRTTSIDAFHALQAVRPLAVALGLFGAIATAAGLLLVAQALSRQIRLDRDERLVLRALGASPAAIARGMLIGPVVSVTLGTMLAVALAVLASPAMPIGPMRRVEVARGFDFDWTVLGFGALAFVVLLVTGAIIATWRDAPGRLVRSRRSTRSPWLVGAATAAGMPPAAVAGIRLAVDSGEGSTAVPVRSVIGGTATAIAALVAALTFGSSMHALVAHPRLFGWNWDVALTQGSGYSNVNLAAAHRVLDHDPSVEAWSGAFFGSDVVDGKGLPLLGMTPGAEVAPPIIDGRPIAGRTEVVLGTATLANLHKHIGDTVVIGSGPRTVLRVVGSATFATVGIVHGAHTSLGVGAWLDRRLVPGYDRTYSPGQNVNGDDPNVVFVRFRPGVDAAREIAHLRRTTIPLEVYPTSLALDRVQRPAEIVNTSEIGSAPALLGGALAAAALVALGVALVAAVRRRRRDLALLKTLGFTRRQLSSAVAWQATVTVVIGLIVGIPAGAILGRALWFVFARQLDVIAQPSVPMSAIALVAVAVVIAANLIAAIPARAARRLQPSLILHSE